MSKTTNNFYIGNGLFISTQEQPTVSGMRCEIQSDGVIVQSRIFFIDQLKDGEYPQVKIDVEVCGFSDRYLSIVLATNALNLINQNRSGIEKVMGAAYLSGLLK